MFAELKEILILCYSGKSGTRSGRGLNTIDLQVLFERIVGTFQPKSIYFFA